MDAAALIASFQQSGIPSCPIAFLGMADKVEGERNVGSPAETRTIYRLSLVKNLFFYPAPIADFAWVFMVDRVTIGSIGGEVDVEIRDAATREMRQTIEITVEEPPVASVAPRWMPVTASMPSALSIPQRNQLPGRRVPEPGEDPLLSLVSDDKLISAVSVRSLELLDQGFDAREVIAIIGVTTEVTHVTRGNSHLA